MPLTAGGGGEPAAITPLPPPDAPHSPPTPHPPCQRHTTCRQRLPPPAPGPPPPVPAPPPAAPPGASPLKGAQKRVPVRRSRWRERSLVLALGEFVTGGLLGVADEQLAVGNDRVVPRLARDRLEPPQLLVGLRRRLDQRHFSLLRED